VQTYKAVDAFINNAPNRALVAVDGWGGEVVADCGEATPENLARAALFAAAPELLAAIQQAEKHLSGWYMVNDESLLEAALDTLRAAINKTKGV
jgi:hypothetical protein